MSGGRAAGWRLSAPRRAVIARGDIGRRRDRLRRRRDERRRRAGDERDAEVRHAAAAVIAGCRRAVRMRGRRVARLPGVSSRRRRVVPSVQPGSLRGGEFFLVRVRASGAMGRLVGRVAEGPGLRPVRVIVAMRGEMRHGRQLGRYHEHAEQERPGDPANVLERGAARPHAAYDDSAGAAAGPTGTAPPSAIEACRCGPLGVECAMRYPCNDATC